MAKKVKISGYAKREFYGNGIEYRNFADDLVGNQWTSEGGNTLFTLGNFKVTTNLDPRLTKNYRTSLFSRYYTLDSLFLDEDKQRISGKESKGVVLNLDKTDLSTYAYFGSLKEFIRVSLENIITQWPASLYVTTTNPTNPNVTNLTFEGRTYDAVENTTQFSVKPQSIINKFGINFNTKGTIKNTFNEGNPLRDLIQSSNYYVISVEGIDYPIIGFTGSNGTSNLTFKVMGNVFSDGLQVNYHIKPNEQKRNTFYQTLNDFEGHILSRKTNFKADFRFFYENDYGATIVGKKTVKWPVSDGYNIDFDTDYYVSYVGKLLEIADRMDSSRSNILNNMLISDSILEFDTLDQKMSKTLNIYGRNFDELKKQTTGIKFAHTVTYNKQNNIPDSLVKNLARTLGWELTTSLFNIDLNGDFLTTDGELFLSPVESEIEFWRRLVLNTPWVWKSKGTRKAIEFLLRFFGTPKGLININEHVYVGSTLVDISEVMEIYELMGLDFNENNIPVDDDGYPRILRNNGGMYYQKGGHWYRTTGGEDATIDILSGNNPHMGPYDGGLEYIAQFNPVIPGFEPFTVDTPHTLTTVHKGYLNYGYGTFDAFYDGNVTAQVNLNFDFSNFYVTELNKCSGFNESCDIDTKWYLQTFLDGTPVTDLTQPFFMGSSGSLPSQTDYTTALELVKTTLGLSSNQANGVYYFIESLEDCESGSQLSGKTLEFRMKLDFEFDCMGETICGDYVVVGEESNGLIIFEGNPTIPSKECCQEMGFTSKLTATGYECYNDIEGIPSGADIYVFVCTALGVDSNDMAIAKTQITSWFNQYKSTNPTHVGNLYFIPLLDERWLDYPNKLRTGVISVQGGAEWNAIAQLPPNLNTGSWVAPQEVMVIALINESANQYHTTTTAFEGEPTSHFFNNYVDLANSLKYHYQFFKGVVYPVIQNSKPETHAFIKHLVGAIEGTTLTQDELNVLDSPVNLSELITYNPYENTAIGGTSPQAYLRPLKEFNWSAIYSRSGTPSSIYLAEQFKRDLNKLMIISEDDNIYTVDSTDIDASETDIII